MENKKPNQTPSEMKQKNSSDTQKINKDSSVTSPQSSTGKHSKEEEEAQKGHS